MISITKYMGRVDELTVQVADVALRIQRRSRQEDRLHGITGARLAALHRLVSTGPLPLTELAKSEAVTAATMTRIVDGLQDGKLVVREKSAPDGRVVLIVPTTLGRTLVAGARTRRLEWLESFLAGLSDADRGAVARGVQILANATEDDASDP